MEQLEGVQVILGDKFDGGGNLGVAERRVRALDQLLEVGGGDLVRRDVQRQDLVGEVLESEPRPARSPALGQRWNGLGNEQTSIDGEALFSGFFERELFMRPG